MLHFNFWEQSSPLLLLNYEVICLLIKKIQTEDDKLKTWYQPHDITNPYP